MWRIVSLVLISLCMSPLVQAKVIGFKEWKLERVKVARLSLERAKQSNLKEAKSNSDHQTPPGEKAVLSNLVKLQQKGQSVGAGVSTSAVGGYNAKKNTPSYQRLRQAELSLEIAQELNVNDYFILYLSQFQSREAFEEAAGKLSKAEVGQLLMAYKKQLLGGPTGEEMPGPSEMKPSRAIQSERNASR